MFERVAVKVLEGKVTLNNKITEYINTILFSYAKLILIGIILILATKIQ